MTIDRSAGFSIPLTMGDWSLIMDAIRGRIAELKRVPDTDASEDEIADAYNDLDNLQGILRQISAEFEKRYGGLPG
jgi:hypothetical protein